jgi:hypothetical protein
LTARLAVGLKPWRKGKRQSLGEQITKAAGRCGGDCSKSSHKVRKLRNSNQSELLISMSKFTSPPMDLANTRSLGVTKVDVYYGCAVAQLREALNAAAAFSNGADRQNPSGEVQAIRLQAHARLKFAPPNASDPRWPPSSPNVPHHLPGLRRLFQARRLIFRATEEVKKAKLDLEISSNAS